jgi:hypothetical protein
MIKIKATGDTTIYTAGKYCEEDILVQVPEATGEDLPELTNEGSATDLLSGKQLIDGEGNIVEGSFTIDNEINTQTDLVAQIQTALQGKAAGGTGIDLPDLSNPATGADILSGKEAINQNGKKISGTIATKTSDNLTVSGATVTVPVGYYASQATKSVATATQATPSITVDSNGKITASATQTVGYVTAGTKSSTKQLDTQAAQTITPGTADKTIAAARYLTGVQTIKGDANLIPANIKNGVSIFGVNGTLEGGSGGNNEGSEVFTSLVNGTITSYSNETLTKARAGIFMSCTNLSTVNLPACQTVDNYAFYQCTSLSSINIPQCISVKTNAFQYCSKLTEVNMPLCTTVDTSGFANCSQLTSINLSACTKINNYAFNYCTTLTEVELPACQMLTNSAFSNCHLLATASLPTITNIYAGVFNRCYNLKSLYLISSSICMLSNSNAFASTPIGGYSTSAGTYGSIYVPTSLVDAYKSATNWAYFSSRFVGI